MPKVPKYSSNVSTPGVGGSTGPSFRENSRVATAENFGGREARNLQNFGKGLQSVAQLGVEAAKYNYQKSKINASNKYYQSQDKLNEKYNAYMNTKGEASVDLADNARKEFEKIYKEESKDLTGLEKEFYTQAFQSDVNSKMNSIYKYQNKAMTEYQSTLRNAQNSGATNSAIIGYNDATVVQHSEEIIAANTMAENAPYGKEVAQRAASDAVSNMHTQVIQSLSSDSAKKAMAYMEAHWDKMSPVTRDAIKTKVEDMALKENAEDTANFLVAQNLEPEEMEKQISKLSDPELQNETRKMATKKYQEKQNMEKLQEKVVFEDEFDKLSKDPFTYQVPNSLSASNEKNLHAWQEKLKAEELEKKGIGPVKHSDWNTYYKLSMMSPSELAKVDLNDYKDKLKFSDAEKLMRSQRNSGEHTKVQTINSYVNQLVKAKVNENDLDGAASLRSQFEGMVNQLPKEKRNDINELNKIKDNLVMQVDYPDEPWFSAGTRWEAIQRGAKPSEIVPEKTPDNVPRGARWVDYTNQGKNVRGWVHSRNDGSQIIYMLEGKEAVPYQVIPKSKVANK